MRTCLHGYWHERATIAAHSILLIAEHGPSSSAEASALRTLHLAHRLKVLGWLPVVLSLEASPPGREWVRLARGLPCVRIAVNDADAAERPVAHAQKWLQRARTHWRNLQARRAARRLVASHSVSVIWSTTHGALPHEIALSLRLSPGIRWIAELSEPLLPALASMTDLATASLTRLEQDVVQGADCIVVASEGTRDLYERRYPGCDASRVSVLQTAQPTTAPGRSGSTVADTFVQAPAILYCSMDGDDCEPAYLLAAIAALKAKRRVDSQRLRLLVDADGRYAELRRLIHRFRLFDLVELLPELDDLNRQHVMAAADGLLLLQSPRRLVGFPDRLCDFLLLDKPLLIVGRPDSEGALRAATVCPVGTPPADSGPHIEAALRGFLSSVVDDRWRPISHSSHSLTGKDNAFEGILPLLETGAPTTVERVDRATGDREKIFDDGNLDRVAHGAAWMLAARLGERSIGLASTAILARLLTPADFGLMAMAMVFVASVEVLGAFGFDWALIRQPSISRAHLDTAWTIRSFVGLVSFVLLWALHGAISDLYDDVRIGQAATLLGFGILVGSLQNPGVILFRRDFDFKPEFAMRVLTKVVGTLVSVALALYYQSFAALLWGTVISRSANTALSYVFHPHRPRPTLSARGELLRFSFWLLLANLLGAVRSRIGGLLLGHYHLPRDAGIITVAGEISELASSEIAEPINRAVYSDYARRAQLGEDLGAAYVSTAPLLWLLCLPIALCIYLCAPQIIQVLLGPSWAEGAQSLRILAIAGVFSILSTNAILVYWAIGRAKLETFVELLASVMLVVLALFLVQNYRAVGIAYATLAAAALSFPVHLVLLIRATRLSIVALFTCSWRVLVASLCLFAAGHELSSAPIQSTLAAVGQLAAVITLSLATYTLSLWLLWRLSGSPAGPERDLLAKLSRVLRPSHRSLRGAR